MFSLLLLAAVCQHAEIMPPCQGRIELHQQNGMLSVTSHCRNLLPTAGHYRYELLVDRTSSNGHSRNTSRGEFEVAPEQEIPLSHSQVNLAPQDTYRIHLRILDLTGHVLAQDSAAQVPLPTR